MQASYESRIADLQLSYDELNSSLIIAQDRFQAVADSFQAKQQVLTAIIEHKKVLQSSLGIGAAAETLVAGPAKRSAPAKPGVGGVFDAIGSDGAAIAPPPPAAGETKAQNAASTVAPESSHAPDKATFFKGAVLKLGSLFHRKTAANELNRPIVRAADAQSARIVRLDMGQSTLLAEATQDVNKETSRLSRVLRGTGINTNSLLKRVADDDDPAPQIAIAPNAEVTDDAFGAGLAEASTAMGKLYDVVSALKAIPLISPTALGSVSSGFGERQDPFNEQLAFHSGIDFSGPKGSDVRVTAPGIVVFAGKKGDYGNAVEVDHGYGIRTRYGHLAKIVAQVGSRLDTGAVVGRLGSTGRSTGPHVHYEVWYDEAVRDPGRFIKAGRDVLKE
jgi:murein DD-endopeptidase MepM/ murein hydrolase activator NlpD